MFNNPFVFHYVIQASDINSGGVPQLWYLQNSGSATRAKNIPSLTDISGCEQKSKKAHDFLCENGMMPFFPRERMGIFVPQLVLPIFPPECKHINNQVGVQKIESRVIIYTDCCRCLVMTKTIRSRFDLLQAN